MKKSERKSVLTGIATFMVISGLLDILNTLSRLSLHSFAGIIAFIQALQMLLTGTAIFLLIES